MSVKLTVSAAPGRTPGRRPDPAPRIAFAEHVFYEFENDKIKRVCSLIDRSAVEKQLRRTTAG
jgi:hypothetical protein